MPSLISDALENYCLVHTVSEPALLSELASETRAKTRAPQMMVGPIEGQTLKLLCQLSGARRVLEIGTFTGYSALWIAAGLPEGGELITCDIDEKSTAIAKKYWAKSSDGDKITLKLGPALETLSGLEPSFDMVFIDADKANYINYWEAAMPLLRLGGLIVTDNVLWSGRVLDPQERSDFALCSFAEHASQDSRVESVLLSVRDGMLLSYKRSD